MEKIGVVIVAGGSGSRMGAAVPKQFLHLGGEPILVHTLRRFLPVAQQVVVVLPEAEIARWEAIVEECGLGGTHSVVAGGATRFESVRNGLGALQGCDIVAIHDGVRPLVSAEMIARGVECARRWGVAIPTVAPVDSFRVEDQDGLLVVIDRSRLRAVQTPQIFSAELLRHAYDCEPSDRFTDDATVVEATGVEMHYYEGERSNIKITTPEDLVIAEALNGYNNKKDK